MCDWNRALVPLLHLSLPLFRCHQYLSWGTMQHLVPPPPVRVADSEETQPSSATWPGGSLSYPLFICRCYQEALLTQNCVNRFVCDVGPTGRFLWSRGSTTCTDCPSWQRTLFSCCLPQTLYCNTRRIFACLVKSNLTPCLWCLLFLKGMVRPNLDLHPFTTHNQRCFPTKSSRNS